MDLGTLSDDGLVAELDRVTSAAGEQDFLEERAESLADRASAAAARIRVFDMDERRLSKCPFRVRIGDYGMARPSPASR